MTRRRSILVFALACLASAPGLAQMNVKKLAEGVWGSTTPDGANVGWFVDGNEVVAVDAGGSPETARQILAKIRETTGKPVRFLVVTHAHGDHAGGAETFAAAGADVICAEKAATQLLAAMQAVQDQDKQAPPPAKKKAAPGKRGPAAQPAPKAPRKPEVLTVADRLRLLGGARQSEIYYLGPAHTDGDLVVVLPQEKILFSGDIALNGVIPFMRSRGLDPRSWQQILTQMAGLPLEQMVPGHGPIGSRNGIAETLDYVRRADEIARRLAEARVPDDQLEQKLRESENQVGNVTNSPDHLANMKQLYLLEKVRLEKAKVTPAPERKPG